jgi:hypothetical protein
MELPPEIWKLIVSESLKNNHDIINGMELNDLVLLESVIAKKKAILYEEKNKMNIKIANELKIGDVFSYTLYTGAEFCRLNELIEYDLKEDEVVDEVVEDLVYDMTFYDVVYELNDNQIVTRSFKKYGDKHTSHLNFINKNRILNKLNYNDIPSIYNMKMKEKKMSYCLFRYKALKNIT